MVEMEECSKCGFDADERRIVSATGDTVLLEWACSCGWRWLAMVPASLLIGVIEEGIANAI